MESCSVHVARATRSVDELVRTIRHCTGCGLAELLYYIHPVVHGTICANLSAYTTSCQEPCQRKRAGAVKLHGSTVSAFRTGDSDLIL